MQPTLHDKHLVLVAPTQVITGQDGWILHDAEGMYHSDIRVISHLSLVMDARVDCVATNNESARILAQRFIIRGVGETGPDPELVLTRTLRVLPGSIRDELLFENVGSGMLAFDFAIQIGSDLARMDSVKTGRTTSNIEPIWEKVTDGASLLWADSAVEVRATVPSIPCAPRRINIGPGERLLLPVNVEITELRKPLFSAPSIATDYLPELQLSVNDRALHRVVTRSLDDLRSLLLIDREATDDAFLAAGAPWYFTLFGRDSLWAAQFLLPTGTDLAMGTLRTLARRQATAYDANSQAEPGKILHEMRAESADLGNGVTLPPIYYGSIDATPLWISLLHAGWKYGAAEHEVSALLPNMQSALDWLAGATGEDGFLRYIDSSGSGLANQGWKDSADGIRQRDGSLSQPPIALCEVQGYAYAAAREAAELQRHFGLGDPDRWEEWAAELSERFRRSFWVDSPLGAHPAVALDRQMTPVSSLTSNIGHLLGTGICSPLEAAQIAKLLIHPELNSGYGLRTMAASTGGYNPLGYHTGSVWSHDTMIAARGLAAEGFRAEAIELAKGVLDASVEFAGRLPELYGGYPASDGPPTAYAASCRPQAWAAAATIEALRIFVGLKPDVPHQLIAIAETAPDVALGLHLNGLRMGHKPVSLRVTDTKRIELEVDGLRITQAKVVGAANPASYLSGG